MRYAKLVLACMFTTRGSMEPRVAGRDEVSSDNDGDVGTNEHESKRPVRSVLGRRHYIVFRGLTGKNKFPVS